MDYDPEELGIPNYINFGIEGLDDRYGDYQHYEAYLPDVMAEVREPNAQALAECERVTDYVAKVADLCARSDKADAVAKMLLCIEAVSTVCAEHYPTTCTKMLDYAAAAASGGLCSLSRNEAIALDAIEALDALATGKRGSVTLDALCEANGLFTRSGKRARSCGVLRDCAVWVGGRSLFDARFVAPPAEYLNGCVDDLVAFINADTRPLNPLAKAALAHLQLVTIHPFVDGNGRVGRALGLRMLQDAGLARGFVLPTTAVLRTRWCGYIRALEMARSTCGPSDPSEFVKLSAWCCGVACDWTRRLLFRVKRLLDDWRERLAARSEHADEVIDAFATAPIMTEDMLSTKLSCDTRPVIEDMLEADILQRRASLYCDADVLVAHELLRAMEAVQSMRGVPRQVEWDV